MADYAAIIEVPAGSRNKYEVDHETGRVFLPPTKGSIGVGECEHCGRKRTLFAARDVTGDPGRVCSRCKKEAGYY